MKAPSTPNSWSSGWSARRVAVIYRQDDWGLTASRSFVDAARDLGAQVVINEAIVDGTRDFRPLITRLHSANVDVIYVALFYADAAVFAQQARQAGLNLPVVTNSSLNNPELIALGADAVEGFYVPTNYFPGDPDPAVQTFLKAYRERWNGEPDQFAAIAYDSIAVIAEAIRTILEGGEPLTRRAVRDALYAPRALPGRERPHQVRRSGRRGETDDLARHSKRTVRDLRRDLRSVAATARRAGPGAS